MIYFFKKHVKNRRKFIFVLFVIILIVNSFKNSNLKYKFYDKIFYKFFFTRYYDFNEFNIKDEPGSKYVLFECVENCGGWADRLKGILSAYAWALITKRNFRIYVTHPCYFQNLVKPKKIPWNSKMIQNGADIQKFKNFSTTYLAKIDDLDFKNNIQFLNITNLENKNDLIVINNNQDWMVSLSKNSYLKKRINELGYDENKFNLAYLFRDWFNEMFVLSDDLRAKYDRILKQVDKSKEKLICAQVRIGGVRPHVSDDFQFNSRNVTKVFWNFIREKFISNKTDYKIFISSDLEEVYNEGEREFDSNKMIKIPGLYTHIDKEEYLKENCERVEKTVLDFYFMENCDYILISQSGFGKLSALRRKNPFENSYYFSSGQIYKFDQISLNNGL